MRLELFQTTPYILSRRYISFGTQKSKLKSWELSTVVQVQIPLNQDSRAMYHGASLINFTLRIVPHYRIKSTFKVISKSNYLDLIKFIRNNTYLCHQISIIDIS